MCICTAKKTLYILSLSSSSSSLCVCDLTIETLNDDMCDRCEKNINLSNTNICRSNHHDRKLTEKNLTLSLEHFCLFCCCCQRNLFMYNVKFFLVRKNSDYRFSQSFFVIFNAMYKIPMHNKWYIALNVMYDAGIK